MDIKKIIRMQAFNYPACIFGGIVISSLLSSLDFELAHVAFFAFLWVTLLFIDYQIGYGFLWIKKNLMYTKSGIRIKIFHASKAKIKIDRPASGVPIVLITEGDKKERIKLPFYTAEASQEKILGALDMFIKDNNLKYESRKL